MDTPMEHLKLWHNLYAGILTPSETALYIHLFMVANSRFWPEWIELTDSQLSLGTNFSIKRIPDAINALVQKKLLESKRGKGKNPSQYNICPLPNYTQTGIINGRKTGDKREINGRKSGDKREINGRLEENSPCESRAETPSKTQLTQHTIINSVKEPEKFSYAENVKMTRDEYAKLKEKMNGNEEAVKWCIEKLDNFKGSSGKPYKSDYRAILNWVVDEYIKKFGSPHSPSVLPFDDQDEDFMVEPLGGIVNEHAPGKVG